MDNSHAYFETPHRAAHRSRPTLQRTGYETFSDDYIDQTEPEGGVFDGHPEGLSYMDENNEYIGRGRLSGPVHPSAYSSGRYSTRPNANRDGYIQHKAIRFRWDHTEPLGRYTTNAHGNEDGRRYQPLHPYEPLNRPDYPDNHPDHPNSHGHSNLGRYLTQPAVGGEIHPDSQHKTGPSKSEGSNRKANFVCNSFDKRVQVVRSRRRRRRSPENKMVFLCVANRQDPVKAESEDK